MCSDKEQSSKYVYDSSILQFAQQQLHDAVLWCFLLNANLHSEKRIYMLITRRLQSYVNVKYLLISTRHDVQLRLMDFSWLTTRLDKLKLMMVLDEKMWGIHYNFPLQFVLLTSARIKDIRILSDFCLRFQGHLSKSHWHVSLGFINANLLVAVAEKLRDSQFSRLHPLETISILTWLHANQWLSVWEASKADWLPQHVAWHLMYPKTFIQMNSFI